MKPITAKFSKRENELTTTIQRVLDNMENNPAFPAPPPALAELKKKAPEFQVARANAKGRDVTRVAIKNDQKAEIQDLLQEVADYVTVTSKGDRTLILTSGFEASSETNSNRNLPPSIEKLDIELGLSGEVTIRTKDVTGVKAYIHQYATEAPGVNTVWVGEGSSHGTHTFEGLSSDKRYWFRVIAIGFNRQRAYSPVVTRVIQ